MFCPLSFSISPLFLSPSLLILILLFCLTIHLTNSFRAESIVTIDHSLAHTEHQVGSPTPFNNVFKIKSLISSEPSSDGLLEISLRHTQRCVHWSPRCLSIFPSWQSWLTTTKFEWLHGWVNTSRLWVIILKVNSNLAHPPASAPQPLLPPLFGSSSLLFSATQRNRTQFLLRCFCFLVSTTLFLMNRPDVLLCLMGNP